MLHRFIGIANVLIPVCLVCFGYGCETQLNSIAQVGIEFAVCTVQANLKLNYKVKCWFK